MFDRLSNWLMDNELMKSIMSFVEIIGSLISMFGYIIITATALLMGYLTFKTIKLMIKITIFINLIVEIIMNIVTFMIKFLKVAKDSTTPKDTPKE